MNQEMLDYFGEPISVYTEQQGVEDGILMETPSVLFPECDLITTNLWNYFEEKVKNCPLTEPIDLLNVIMLNASIIYDKGKFKGDNDRNFFVIKCHNLKDIWFCRNGNNKLTAMLPEDY